MNFTTDYGDYSDDGYMEFENTEISNLEELYWYEDVEGPLHLGEICDTKLNYDIDLAKSKENSIQIFPSPIETGFTRQDEDYDLKVQKAHIVKEVREVKLRNTKSFGVTFSEPGPAITYRQNIRISPAHSLKSTSEYLNNGSNGTSEEPSSSSSAGAFTTSPTTASSSATCKHEQPESMSNLQFYSFGSNLLVVDRMIALAGNCEVGCAFQLEGMRTVWDLSTDATLLGSLHKQGLTEALLAVVCNYSSSGGGEGDASILSDCIAYEKNMICALAMVTLANLSACEAAMLVIAKSALPVLEAVSALCGRYIDLRGPSRVCADNNLGSGVDAAISAPELSRQSRLFVERLTQHLQIQSAAAASAVCPVSAQVLPSLYKFGGAGGSIVRVTTHGKLGEDILAWARPEGWTAGVTAEWPLTKFEHALPIALGYLLFVFLGQIIMPFLPTVKGLYPFKFAYNMIQVMLCSYMCIEAGVRAYSAGYTLLPCNNFDHENPPIAFILYVFYISKILDFMDTVFIILEKRWKQLSFLHVYHHTSIFLFYWLNMNVGYDGDVYLTIVLNGLIHTVMYTYYFVSLHTKEIWWKSALTMSQMIQFVLMNAQAGYLVYYGCNKYPMRIIWAYLYYIVSLLALFAHFFVLSYVMKGSSKKGGKSRAVKDE